MLRVTSLVMVVAACGGRTGLGIEEYAPIGDASTRDATRDAPSDAPNDAPPDAPPPGCPLRGLVSLATGQSPMAIVTDDRYVYWINDTPNVIRRVPKTGGAVFDVGPILSPVQHGMAIDDAYVYAGSGEIDRVPKAGGSPSLVAQGENAAYGMTADATTFYWAEITGPVRSTPKTGGPVNDLAFAKGGATEVLTDGAFAYYTTWYPPNGGAWRVPIGGGTSQLLQNAAYSDYLAIDATNLYWDTRTSSSGPGSVWTVPKTGGTAIALAPTADGMGLAVDDTYVYWADAFDHISRVPKKGGPAAVFIAGLRNVRALAIDTYCVYWTVDGVGIGGASK